MRRLVFLAFLALAGCGGDSLPRSPVIPTHFGPPSSIRITGDFNFTLVPQSRQLTASATFANGEIRNITAVAEWHTSNSAVMTVTAGLVRVEAFGDAQISASYRGVSSGVVIVTARPAAAITALTITGPAEIAPLTTTQFTATGTFSDGSTRDLTSSATWTTFTTLQVRHAGGGRFDALASGDATISASAMGRATSRQLIVVPQGTYRLSGSVRDASGGVENVRVEVISGTGTGLSSTSGFNGGYALHGVAGDVRLRASAPGYTTQELNVTVGTHQVRDVDVAPVSPSVGMSGDWTLVVSTSSACSDTWPAAARRREVHAVVNQQETLLNVRFPGHVFFPVDNRGRIAGTAFSLTLYFDFYYLDYGLLERLSSTEWVGVNGFFSGTATQMLVTGQFAGNINYYPSSASTNFPSGTPRTCAADPTFEFRRR